MTVARRFIAGSGTHRAASRRGARTSPPIAQAEDPPSINSIALATKISIVLPGRDQFLNSSTGDKSPAYFQVVPPGPTDTTALNAEMSNSISRLNSG
jgi:hypothetical protein